MMKVLEGQLGEGHMAGGVRSVVTLARLVCGGGEGGGGLGSMGWREIPGQAARLLGM